MQKGKAGVGLALSSLPWGKVYVFKARFKLHSVYDAGVEFQGDPGDNDGGIQYAELSQQGSGEVTQKVRMGAEPSLGSHGSISWVCQPSHLLFLALLSL